MVKGISNKTVLRAVSDALNADGMLRSKETRPGEFSFDVQGPVIQIVQESAIQPGAGRITVSGGSGVIIGNVSGIMSPDPGRGLTPGSNGSGTVTPPDGSGFIIQTPGFP